MLFFLHNLEISFTNELKNTVFTFDYNSYSQLEKLVENKNIGVIKMEVARNNLPNLDLKTND